jgi:DNA-binding IscR family transcriptional regulator
MLQINNRVVTGIAVMEYLLKNYDKTVVAREIAREAEINENAITVLTPQLVRAGLVASEKGVYGGLRATNKDATLWDVVSAVSLPIKNAPPCESWESMWAFFERTLKRTLIIDLVDK